MFVYRGSAFVSRTACRLRPRRCATSKGLSQQELLLKQVRQLSEAQREAFIKALREMTPKSPKQVQAPDFNALWALFLVSAVPMVGFGFVDNFIMIIAGEFLEAELGGRFHLSTLAAAGLGNMISDICGLGLGGIIEETAGKLGFKHKLSPAQLRLSTSRLVHHTATVVGISVGCILGMVPLLFYDPEIADVSDEFKLYAYDIRRPCRSSNGLSPA